MAEELIDTKEDMSDMDETMIIPANHFVSGCDLDVEQPFCTLSPLNPPYENKKVLIPKALAHFLMTHWCGSEKLQKSIEDRAIRLRKHEIEEKFEELMKKVGYRPE